MSAPTPYPGTYSTSTNPWYAAYQTHQFKVTSMSLPGSNAVHNSLTGAQNVFDALNAPPAAATTAVAESDPLEEQADFWNLNPQVITINGVPTGGSISVIFPGSAASTTWLYNASAATVQTAIRTIAACNAVTVAGAAGGPWTVTGSQLAANMLILASNTLSGGTSPSVKISSPGQQAGIVPF